MARTNLSGAVAASGLLVALLALGGCGAGLGGWRTYEDGYADGYEDGADDAYTDGFQDGFEIGYDEGYFHATEHLPFDPRPTISVGWEDTVLDATFAVLTTVLFGSSEESEYDEGYADGYDDGYFAHIRDGVEDGYCEGYRAGYDDGLVALASARPEPL